MTSRHCEDAFNDPANRNNTNVQNSVCVGAPEATVCKAETPDDVCVFISDLGNIVNKSVLRTTFLEVLRRCEVVDEQFLAVAKKSEWSVASIGQANMEKHKLALANSIQPGWYPSFSALENCRAFHKDASRSEIIVDGASILAWDWVNQWMSADVDFCHRAVEAHNLIFKNCNLAFKRFKDM